MSRADLGTAHHAAPSRRVVDPGTLTSITPNAVLHIPHLGGLPTISLSERGSIMPVDEPSTLHIVPDMGTDPRFITLPPPNLAAPFPGDDAPSRSPSYRPFPYLEKTDLTRRVTIPPLTLEEPLIITEE